MNTINLLIADDHTIVRIGLKALFASASDISVVGEARNGVEAIAQAAKHNPDVIIMDLVMPRKNGVDATREILAERPETKVIILTSYGESDGIAHALEAGASGALIKTADDAVLVAAVRKVFAGGRYVSPEIKRLLAENPPVPELSSRQKEIIQSLVKGLTNKEIASNLGIRRDSVEQHINALFAKLGSSNRTETVAIALRKQLLKI